MKCIISTCHSYHFKSFFMKEMFLNVRAMLSNNMQMFIFYVDTTIIVFRNTMVSCAMNQLVDMYISKFHIIDIDSNIVFP